MLFAHYYVTTLTYCNPISYHPAGLTILHAMGAAYGGKKVYDAKKVTINNKLLYVVKGA